MAYKEVWLITGASTGFGLHLTNGLLQNGHRVAAISRDDNGSWQDLIRRSTDGSTGGCERMEDGPAEDILRLSVDFTSEDSVKKAIRQTIFRFGRIDNVVNYAGYDLSAPVEALSDHAINRYFEENVFGSFHVLKQVIPYLRKQVIPYLRNQGSGTILNFSSPAAVAAAAGSPLYAATKLAVERLSKELTADIETLGIRQDFIGAEPTPGVFRQQQPRKEVFRQNACGDVYLPARPAMGWRWA